MNQGHHRGARMAALILASCITSTMLLASDAGAATKRVKPTAHGGVVKVSVGKKSRVYYRASVQKPVDLRVNGPTPLRILTRYLFPDPTLARRLTYSLRVEVDGVVFRTISIKAGASSRATLLDGMKVGAMKELILQIPAGQHAVRIYPVDKNKHVALRLYLDSGRKLLGRWIPFSPDSYLAAVRLQSKDRESTYYRFDQKTAVELTIRGPLRFKVGTRVDFGTTNGYTQRYVVRTLLDGNAWKSFPLSSTASHTTTYPDHGEITPGAEKNLTLSVPAGVHRLTILLDGTTAAGATLRMQVNERELNKTKKPRSPATSRG